MIDKRSWVGLLAGGVIGFLIGGSFGIVGLGIGLNGAIPFAVIFAIIGWLAVKAFTKR